MEKGHSGRVVVTGLEWWPNATNVAGFLKALSGTSGIRLINN
jgi:hypothetical protein